MPQKRGALDSVATVLENRADEVHQVDPMMSYSSSTTTFRSIGAPHSPTRAAPPCAASVPPAGRARQHHSHGRRVRSAACGAHHYSTEEESEGLYRAHAGVIQ